jgi:hypothetical protein
MSAHQQFIDEAAIRNVHLRYCRGVDRMDWELIRDCYHADGTDDHGSYKGGVDGFIDWLKQAMPKWQSTTHFTGNQLVEVTGDSAWAEHYALVTHRRAATAEAGAADCVVSVRYVDRMERRAEEWRIAHRTVIADWDRVDPVAETWLKGGPEPSRRDRTDFSYRR